MGCPGFYQMVKFASDIRYVVAERLINFGKEYVRVFIYLMNVSLIVSVWILQNT